jgi:putative ABC transport system permease protein
MIKNYLKIAIRTFHKNPVFSIINVTGLMIGLVSSILIGLWVADELSWDNFHINKERLYRVYLNGKDDEGMFSQMAIPLPLWEEFKTNESAIEYVSPTNWGWGALLTAGEKKLYKNTYFVGEDFLKMFSFELVQGSKEYQLHDPSTLVITESTARALFGEGDAIGKIVRVSNSIDLTVSGVLKDPPANSSFKFGCLIPFQVYIITDPVVKRSLTNWGNNSYNLYVQFHKDADPMAIENRVRDVIKKRSGEDTDFEVTFLAMDRWHLFGEFENGKSVSGDIVYVRIFSITAIFILVIACINFTNLATAQSQHRAKEVGIRKSVGSARKNLVAQFLLETVLMAAGAFTLAIAVVEFVLPYYNSFLNRNLEIDYSNPTVWMCAILTVSITGLMAGSYPAFYLSSFRPVAVLKGVVAEGTRGVLARKFLVTSQFFFSIVLVLATIVTYLQLEHLKGRSTGYDQRNLLMVWAGDITKHHQAMKKDLLEQNLATAVTTSSSPINAIYSYQGDVTWSGKREDQRNNIATISIGYHYSETTATKMLAGRDFSEDHNDSASVILNEAAVKYMGLKDPVGEIITSDDQKYTVVGVLENAVMTNPYGEPEATAFFFDPRWANEMLIRLPSDKNTVEVLHGVARIYAKYNPDTPFGYRFADQEYAKKFTTTEMIGKLSNLFASLAIFISCLGLFGLAAFTAERRTKEIGIRKVLGASVSGLVALLSKDFALLVLIAFCIAAPLTLWQANEVLSEFAYRVSIPWWIAPVTGLSALMLAVLTVATQSIKTAGRNPVKSLRTE